MISLRDRGLKNTFASMNARLEAGEKLQDADVQALVASAQDGPGVTQTEKADLEKILATHGQDMDPTARANLAAFIDQQNGGGSSGGANLFGMQIQNATIRKALTGEDGGEAILGDNHVSSAEVQRLLDIVNANGIVSGREKRDLATLLKSPELRIGITDREKLERVAGIFLEPAPPETVTGASIASAHVAADATYRKLSLPRDVLSMAGVPTAITNLMSRADTLGSTGDRDNQVSVEELLALEQNGALLPDEVALLPKVWELMEIRPLQTPAAPGALPALEVQDVSVRPSVQDVSALEIAVADLPASLQQPAQRARLIAQGSGADLGVVTVADLQKAIDENHDASTPADRAQFAGEVMAAVHGLAVERAAASAPALAAKAILPDLGTVERNLVNDDDFRIDLATTTSLTGVMARRAVWTPLVKTHDRFSTAHYPSAIPKASHTGLDLAREHALHVELPPGHKLVLVGKGNHTGTFKVLGEGDTPVGNQGVQPGDYRALLFANGEIVTETALRIEDAKAERKDASSVFGYDLETVGGDKVGLVRAGSTTGNANAGWQEQVRAVVGASHQLPTAAVSLAPGRYEGDLKVAYNATEPFLLDVLPGNHLELTLEGKTVRLFPTQDTPTRFEGHVDEDGLEHRLVRFDPTNNTLTAVNEKFDTWHGSSGWYGEVESHVGGSAQVTAADRIA